MKKIFWLIFIANTFLLPVFANSEKPDGFASEWSEFSKRYREIAKTQKVVGSSVYFAHKGKVIAREHYGMADLVSKRKVDENTIYHWASITKTFTAVAVMQLVERGRISLDDPVSKYLPEVRKVHNPFGSMDDIKLRHLITHTSGFRGSTFPWDGAKDWHPHEPKDWSQVAAMMPYTRIHFKPGSKYSYSNPGLSMLGRIVEEVSGDDIEVYITKNILMPLGMTQSYFDNTPYYLLSRRSNNYFIKDGAPLAQGLDFDTGATNGNGGLNTPVADMLKWLNFWLGAEDNGNFEKVLPRKTLEKMWQPGFPTTEKTVKERMGMVFFLIDHPPAGKKIARRYVGHTGSQKAFVSFVYIDPKTKAAVIFASNTTDRKIKPADALLRVIRKDLFEKIFPLFANQ